MKTTIKRAILEKLNEAGDVAMNILIPPHPRSRLARALLGFDGNRKVYISPHSFPVVLSRLIRDGLVVKKKRGKKSIWRITQKGNEWLERQPRQIQETRPDGIKRLVIFDIPERERRKRDMLRSMLVESGFSKLQKSVWIGERPLPEDFVSFLYNMGIKQHTHIFSVQKEGTLPK